MQRSLASSRGFSILDLIIVIAIIGILAVIAYSSYQNYTRRAYYVTVIDVVKPYRTAVADCAQKLATLTGCDAGSNSIPAAITTATGPVASLEVRSGVITVTPVAARGVETRDTYILTPTLTDNGTLTWASTGRAVKNGYAK